jgi:hypothetical protein
MKVTGAEQSLGPILTEIMTTETSQQSGVTVVGASDIKAMLGFEQEKQLLGCADDVSCMAEIGGALGVDLLLVSDLGRVGATYVLNLKLIDASAARVKNRLYRTVAGEADALIDTVRKSIPELLAEVTSAPADEPKPPTAETATKPEPPPKEVPDEPVTPPTEDEGAVDSGPSTWPMWTLVGVGGAALLAGTGLQVAARREYDKGWTSYALGPDDDPTYIYPYDLETRLKSASRLSKVALGLFIVGGVATAGGLTWLLLTPDGESQVTVTPSVGDGSAGFAVTGGF